MEFEPISTTRMVALMIAGGLFACAGLYMMLRPRPQGAAKIELFGLKFESSSAGLLVFIVGAAFLSVTLFVPEERARASGGGVTAATALPAARPAGAAMSLPSRNLVEEVEPNDEQFAANVFSTGQRVKGNTKSEEPDWFRLDVPEGGLVGYEIMLKLVEGNEIRLSMYNAREENVGWINASDGAQYLPIKTNFSDHVYFKIWSPYSAGGDYELALVPPGG